MSHNTDALLSLLAPATRKVASATAPKTRKRPCKKCPFGGAGLTPQEFQSAELLKARLSGRMSAGESVVWACHESATRERPQICPGFLAWTRPRPELES